MSTPPARRLAFFLMRCVGIPWLFRFTRQRRRVTFLTYHEMSPELGRRQLRALGKCYHFISLREYVEARKQGSVAELPRTAAVLTFDDGHRGNYALLPLFRELGIPVTIFLVSGVVGTKRRLWFSLDLRADQLEGLKQLPNRERLSRLSELGYAPEKEAAVADTLSSREVDAMRDTVDFQAHTVFHPILPNCEDDESWHEIAECKHQLETEYGLDIYAFAYPNGDFGEREVEYARRAGYQCALTTQPGSADDSTDLFRIPRMVINGAGSPSEIIVQASGAWSWLRPSLVKALGAIPLGRLAFRIAARKSPQRGSGSDA